MKRVMVQRDFRWRRRLARLMRSRVGMIERRALVRGSEEIDIPIWFTHNPVAHMLKIFSRGSCLTFRDFCGCIQQVVLGMRLLRPRRFRYYATVAGITASETPATPRVRDSDENDVPPRTPGCLVCGVRLSVWPRGLRRRLRRVLQAVRALRA